VAELEELALTPLRRALADFPWFMAEGRPALPAID
jgi:hypothetical protein